MESPDGLGGFLRFEFISRGNEIKYCIMGRTIDQFICAKNEKK